MRLLIRDKNGQSYELWPTAACPSGTIAEDGAYRLSVRAGDGEDLAGCHLFLGDVDRGAGRYERSGELSWTWEAHDYAGRMAICVEQVGHGPLMPTCELVVDPNHNKLARDDFQRMIDDITAQATIAYSLSPATNPVSIGKRSESLGLAQLEYVRQQIEPLQRTVEAIARRPRRELVEEVVRTYLDTARDTDDRTLNWMLKHPGELASVAHPELAPPNVQSMIRSLRDHAPTRVIEGKRHITYDVYENRLLKHFLQRLSQAMRRTQAHLAQPRDSLDNDIKRLAQRRSGEVHRHRRTINNLLELDFLREVTPLRQLQPVTQALRRDPHYASFYRIYRQFDRAMSPFDGGPYDLSLEKTWQLYEYWCFFQVVAALRELFGTELAFDASAVLKSHLDGVSLALPNAEIRINDRVEVWFQKTYRYYGWLSRDDPDGIGTCSHEMRPDIAIHVRDHTGQITRIILLDPKYRVHGSSLNQAIDDLHRYRDAIVDQERRRLVHTALALCPSDANANRYFRRGFQAKHGLGALALSPSKPENFQTLTSTLAALLDKETHA